MAISRHGINRGDSGPLLSASFEETVEVLFKSAIFARKDDVDGVTPNIMLGQLAHVGTGVSDLLLDSAQLEHAVELEAPDQQQNASLREWGDASPDAVPGQAPAMTPYASSPAGLYGASPARGGATPGWGDAAFVACVEIKFSRRVCRIMASTLSTRRLLDDGAPDSLLVFHTGFRLLLVGSRACCPRCTARRRSTGRRRRTAAWRRRCMVVGLRARRTRASRRPDSTKRLASGL